MNKESLGFFAQDDDNTPYEIFIANLRRQRQARLEKLGINEKDFEITRELDAVRAAAEAGIEADSELSSVRLNWR